MIPLPGGHRCVLTTDAEVYCWGGNTHGETGQPQSSVVTTPTLVPPP